MQTDLQLMAKYVVSNMGYTKFLETSRIRKTTFDEFMAGDKDLGDSAEGAVQRQFKNLAAKEILSRLKAELPKQRDPSITNYDDDETLTDITAPTSRSGADRSSRSHATCNNGITFA